MDLVGEMLAESLARDFHGEVRAALVRPIFRRRLSRLAPHRRTPFNADRLLNRMIDYPRHLRRLRANFDLFHIIDHSYSHLVHALPARRVLVTCHDLETFRCLLHPETEPRSRLFIAMTRRIMAGLCKAAKVSCVSDSTRAEIERHGLLPSNRLTTIHNGIHPALSATVLPAATAEVERLLGAPSFPELLHVGSTVRRKQIELLIRVLAHLRPRFSDLRLIQVGGALTAAQTRLAKDLDVSEAIAVMPHLAPPILAAVYQRAALTVLPSSAEGFGLPLIESIACGTPVLASDLDAMHEVGGPAAQYCAAQAPVEVWSDAIAELLSEREHDPTRWAARRAAGRRWAARFSWQEYARRSIELYRELADGAPPS